jgi:DNA-binding IclR family transcriptional regulator
MPRISSTAKERLLGTSQADVNSAGRALDILELLAKFPEGLSLTDIGKHLDIPLSSLHGLIATLINRSYVLRSEPGLQYRIGPRLAQIAISYRSQTDLVLLADPIMTRIRNLTEETTSLTVLQGDTIVFIHKRPAAGRVQVVNPVGTRLPAHATGSGKIMLAYLPPEEVDRLYPQETLPALTPNTITSKKLLKAALREACAKGYAYDHQESERGVWAVASCIHSEDGKPIASISVVAPLFRIQEKDSSRWYEYVLQGANEVSALLGYREG